MSRRNDAEFSDEDWWRKAACVGSDPSLFFSHSLEVQRYIAALACGPCIVRAECLEYALENRQEHGVWGGTTESERLAIKTRRVKQEPA